MAIVEGMKRDVQKYFILMMVLLIAICSKLPAQRMHIRDGISVEPQYLYAEMFALIQREDWLKLERSVAILKPIGEESDSILNATSFQRLSKAVSNRRGQEVKIALLLMIIDGMESLLISSTQTASLELRKDGVRQAFTEFLEIEAYLTIIDFKECQLIKHLFRRSYSLVGDPERLEVTTREIAAHLENIMRSI